MMKRRWSNNGGFTLRMLEESSSEVTSSSAALVMSPGMAMSPTSLGSPEYSELDMWGYDDTTSYSTGGPGSVITNNGNLGVCNNNGMTNITAIHNNNNNNNTSSSIIMTPTSLSVQNSNNMQHVQNRMIPLPSLMQANTIMHTPRSESVNSISSGMDFF